MKFGFSRYKEKLGILELFIFSRISELLLVFSEDKLLLLLFIFFEFAKKY